MLVLLFFKCWLFVCWFGLILLPSWVLGVFPVGPAFFGVAPPLLPDTGSALSWWVAPRCWSLDGCLSLADFSCCGKPVWPLACCYLWWWTLVLIVLDSCLLPLGTPISLRSSSTWPKCSHWTNTSPIPFSFLIQLGFLPSNLTFFCHVLT